METSLAEDVQEKKMTLPPESFFFMSPYRSFTTAGCFSRFSHPPPTAMIRTGVSAKNGGRVCRGAGCRDRKPVMVGAIPFDTSSLPSCLSPRAGSVLPHRKAALRAMLGQQPMDVVQRREIPSRTPLWRWWRARRR
jgi:isochorismate synthase